MNILNGLLLLAVVAVAYDVIVPFLNVTTQTSLPAVGKWETETGNQQEQASLPNVSFADYVTVGEQNLFHPERKIPEEKRVEVEAKAVVMPKPDLVLYGTLLADDLSIAYLEDRKAPYSTPGRGTRPKQLKKGDSIGGYVLRSIEPNRVVLMRGEDQLVVTLDEQNKKRAGDTAAPQGGAPARAAAGAAASSVPGGVPAGPPRRDMGASPAGGGQATTPGTAAASGAGSSSGSSASATPASSPVATNPPATNASPGSAPNAPPTPSGSAGMQNLPPRSKALSDMLTTTPAGVRNIIKGE
jgi:hypothetical protein